jgi:hypothetical protein
MESPQVVINGNLLGDYFICSQEVQEMKKILKNSKLNNFVVSVMESIFLEKETKKPLLLD